MKKFMAVFLMLVVMLSWTSVNAASLCSYERQVELKKIASAVKMTYEEAQEEADPNSYISKSEANPEDADEYEEILYNDYFKLKVLNVTEDIYVKIENSINDDVKYIRYVDTNEGTFTIDWKNLSEVATITYTVYSSDKTECANEELRSGLMTLPRYNDNYRNNMCKQVPDYYLCQKYISVNITTVQFYDNVSAYLEKEKGNDENSDLDNARNSFSISEFIKGNKKILIIGLSVLIVGGGVAVVIVTKKRRSRVI